MSMSEAAGTFCPPSFCSFPFQSLKLSYFKQQKLGIKQMWFLRKKKKKVGSKPRSAIYKLLDFG